MAIDERARQQMARALERVLGEEEAVTLLAHLPPGGWTDVATTDDVERVAERIRAELYARIDALGLELHGRIDALREELLGRIAGVQGRIEGLEGRIEGLEGRIDGLEGRIDGLEGRIDAVREELIVRIDAATAEQRGAINNLRSELLAAFRAELIEAITRQTRTIVLSLTGSVVSLGGLAVVLARVA